MKFRRLIFILILAALLGAYFTKPSKEDFVNYIQPTVSLTQIPPAVEFQDKFLYIKIKATYVDLNGLVQKGARSIAPAKEKNYIGLFGRFWEMD